MAMTDLPKRTGEARHCVCVGSDIDGHVFHSWHSGMECVVLCWSSGRCGGHVAVLTEAHAAAQAGSVVGLQWGRPDPLQHAHAGVISLGGLAGPTGHGAHVGDI